MLIPGGAALAGIWKTISWVVENLDRLAALAGVVKKALEAVTEGVEGVASAVVQSLKTAVSLLVAFLAKYLGVDDLIKALGEQLNKFLGWIKAKINAFIDWLLGKAAAGTGAGCAIKAGTGAATTKAVQVRNSSVSPCTNAFVVASQDVDETITCVGSQFPWTGSGQAPNWASYQSVKAYGNFRSDHGQKLKPQQLQNAADNQNNACRQTQFYDDSIVVLIEQRTPPCPGKYVIAMGMAIGRQFVQGGNASAPIEGLTKAFVGRRKDGTIFSIYPVRDAFKIDEGKCPPGPDLPGNP